MASTPRALEAFSSALSRGALVFDAAMGTALHGAGVPYSACMDQVTLGDPARVSAVHTAHLAAGAQVLGTNSFGANRLRLATHGLEAELEAINRGAVRLARQAASGRAYVAGVVGPSGSERPSGAAERTQLRRAFEEQCRVLIDEGVDLVSLETFRSVEELFLALEAALEASAGRAPVLASASFDVRGGLADGTQPEALVDALGRRGAAAVGVNCADGPELVAGLALRMVPAGLPVVAQPNAGLPQRTAAGDRYLSTPEEFQHHARRMYDAGVKAVGGCCGTGPGHVRAIRSALQ
jgi:methionine synthase I (cobalamin-dependent)